MLRIGFVLNPLAGIGGPVALKGSDGVADRARSLGGTAAGPAAALRMLTRLNARRAQLSIRTARGVMGEDALATAGLSGNACGPELGAETTAEDTRAAVRSFLAQGCDLIIFVGGDGTARDVHAGLAGARVPVLGVPAGVKMHSGVFAVTPEAAARVVEGLLDGDLVGLRSAEVRDLDESARRRGQLRTSFHGELLVPDEPRWIQQTKVGGRESEALVLTELAAHFDEAMAATPEHCWVFAPGGTTAGICEALGLPATLLGVDVYRAREPLALDVSASALHAATRGCVVQLVLSFTGGQGALLGRGNQQLRPAFIASLGAENRHVVATRSKLA